VAAIILESPSALLRMDRSGLQEQLPLYYVWWVFSAIPSAQARRKLAKIHGFAKVSTLFLN